MPYRSLPLLLVALLLLPGCAFLEGAGRVRPSSRDAAAPEAAIVAAKKGKAPQDDYLAVQAKGKGGDFAVVKLSRDLVPPFRYEVRAGFMDAEAALPAGAASFFCTELDERADTAARFFALCVQPTFGGGLQPFVNIGVIGQSGSQQFVGPTFTDTEVVDLAIEATVAPNEITFYARPESDDPDAPYTAITTQPYTVDEPLFPTIGVVGLAKKTEVGFDRFAFPTNTPANVALSDAADAANTIWEAADGILAALDQLDGAVPDLDGARTSLLAARDGLDGITDTIDALDGKDAAKAGKQMKSLPKKLDKLVAKIDKAIAKGKLPKSLSKQTLKLLKNVAVATELLNPLP